jgi:hypothetical protein
LGGSKAVADIFWESDPLASRRQRTRSLIVWILLVLFAVLFGVGWTFRAYGRFGDQLSVLGGMALGDTRGDARYKLGVPPAVYGSDEPGEAGMRVYYTDPLRDPQKDPANVLPAGTDINTFHTWSYDKGLTVGPHLDLTFDPRSRRVSRIACIDQSDPSTSYCGRLVGLGVDDPESRVVAQLGSPTRQSIDDQTGVKTMDYSDIGVVFLLARQRIFGMSVVGNGARKQAPVDRFLIWYSGDLKAALKP